MVKRSEGGVNNLTTLFAVVVDKPMLQDINQWILRK